MISRQVLNLARPSSIGAERSPVPVSVTIDRTVEVALPNETTIGRVYDLPGWYYAPYQIEDRIPYDRAAQRAWLNRDHGAWTPRDEQAYQAVLGWMQANEPASKPEGPWEMFGPTAIARLGQVAGYAVQALTGAPVGGLIDSLSGELAQLAQSSIDAEAARELLAVTEGLGNLELTRYRLDWYLYTASMGYRYDPVTGQYEPIGVGKLGAFKPSSARPSDYSATTNNRPRAGTQVPGIGLGIGLRDGRPTRGPGRPTATSGPSWWTLGLLAVATAAALIAT